MQNIQRFGFQTRIHRCVVHNGVVYLTGQVGTPGRSASEQAVEVFAKIDELLADAGTDKTRILQSTLWLSDMVHFADVNLIWDTWIEKEHAPARSTAQVGLASAGHHVEITVIAAL